jgi:hypothetical protein
VKRILGVLAGLVVGLAAASPASAALHAPELFVRLQPWATSELASDWIPLASAPAFDYIGGYQIGYRLQDSGEPHQFQTVALTISGVPDGTPTQPMATPPYCVGRVGTPGEIVEAGGAMQFEGDGTYTVRVSVGTENDPSACMSGPSTTATFTVGTRVAPELVGEPRTFRAAPLPPSQFVGVRAADPPGGLADIRCALDATIQPDGSPAGAVVAPDRDSAPHGSAPEDVFPRPGAWTCASRGVAEGVEDNLETALFGTPWSAPLPVEVRSDFRRRSGSVAHQRAKRPRFTFKAEWAALSAGAAARVTVSRVRGCKRKGGYKLRKAGTFRGRFGAKRLRLRIRRPGASGFYIAHLAFSGTRFVRAGTDPTPIFLVVQRKRMGFADERVFPRC